MTKKNKPSHTEAKKYLDTYTGKIRQKFLDQKKEKALFELLNISPEKPEEESIRMKEEMKKFVQELQSDKNYAAMKKIYHEQMKNIHEFNKFIHDYSQELEKFNMKAYKSLAKEKFFAENPKTWDTFALHSFAKKFRKTFDNLSDLQKKQIYNEASKFMNDKMYFTTFSNRMWKNYNLRLLTMFLWTSIPAWLLSWALIRWHINKNGWIVALSIVPAMFFIVLALLTFWIAIKKAIT